MATSGTVPLDEIGDMLLLQQSRLLSILQNNHSQHVGDTASIPLNLRFLAATNRNIKKKAAQGKFLKELYAQLSVVIIEMPPLQARIIELFPH